MVLTENVTEGLEGLVSRFVWSNKAAKQFVCFGANCREEDCSLLIVALNTVSLEVESHSFDVVDPVVRMLVERIQASKNGSAERRGPHYWGRLCVAGSRRTGRISSGFCRPRRQNVMIRASQLQGIEQ